MKPLRIRQWMLIGMLIVLIVPRLFYEIPGLFDRLVLENGMLSRQQAAMDSLMREVGQMDIDRWRDGEWQAKLEDELSAANSGVVLLDASGNELYRYIPSGSDSTAERELSVMDHGEMRGHALFYSPKQTNAWATGFAIFAGLCAILFIGWKMGRVVVRPLEAMSAVARRIADGDLDFQLPRSTVMEVADVSAAIQAMGTGLRESLIRQSELEEERRFFISAIAHDLRTPLFALRGFLARLERGGNPEKTERYVAICVKKAEQLEHLVSDLFSFGQMSSLEQLLRLSPLDIEVLFREIVAEYAPLCGEKEIALTFDVSGECRELQGDSRLLRRAIGNLLDNALRYSPANGRVSIHLQLEHTGARFTIEDAGPGIAESHLPHIFEPFYRGEDSRNPEYGGTGLGLTIAQRILRAHNGGLAAGNRSEDGGAILTGWVKR